MKVGKMLSNYGDQSPTSKQAFPERLVGTRAPTATGCHAKMLPTSYIVINMTEIWQLAGFHAVEMPTHILGCR